MKSSKLQAKIPPLREISLNTRPLTKRAVTWSCDGELAVAADDSVHVFVPLFPDPSSAAAGDEAGGASDDDDAAQVGTENGGEDDDLRPSFLRQKQRKVVERRQAQFVAGKRQINVSHPRIHPKVNRELFEVAGLPFPYGGAAGLREREVDEDDSERSDADEAGGDDVYEGDDYSGDGKDERITPGAGRNGVITGAGATLNHVVSLAWSPSGLGRSRRPILAVLTSAGYLAFYGDYTSSGQSRGVASGAGFASVGRDDGTLKQRDLSSWGILFGVGERLLVPGQENRVDSIGEKIASFAWAREVSPGQALLAYANNDQEVIVLSVQSTSTAANGNDMDNGERTVWRVHEVARFAARGPHPSLTSWDPDWVPTGTCFGLRWSPWLSSDGSRTCVISYVDRNFVGFRKVTLQTPWVKGDSPHITADTSDVNGTCVHLSTDAFVEFEDAIWTKGQSKVVRGVVAAGFHVKPFEVSISGPQLPSPIRLEPHTTSDCGTTYLSTNVDRSSTNPIADLIIHPPDMRRPSATPTYTLIRQAATSTNNDWYQSNATLPALPSDGPQYTKPQWVTELAQKLAILVPADAHMRHTTGEGEGGSDTQSAKGDDSDEEMADADEEDDEDIEKAVERPEVHPTRFRLHGLAAATGGRATAVLVSAHSTQTPDRIGWWGLRSVLLFGSVDRRHTRRTGEDGLDATEPSLQQLTTEGRMMNWMYGAGADVAGVTTDMGNGSGGGSGGNDKTRDIFRDAIAAQRCALCQTAMERRQGMTICAQGHFWSTCGASGLAIQAPGISHSCGVCGVRTLKVGELVKLAPGLEARVKEELTAEVCGNCGGKFVD